MDYNYYKRMNATKTILEENQIRPSYQRIKIYKLLSETKDHPSVDTIFNELKEEIPSLSKMTIYNTLNLFVKKGIARTVTIEENEIRFDANTTIHGHFKCKSCGRIIDFELDDARLPIPEGGFTVEGFEFFVRGVCPLCQSK